MPPCMQTSVAPSSHASSARSADLVHRQRVGVGVGAPLGEGAEPAAGVADVGEVDVPVDDVGDVVADDVARAGRRPARPRASSSAPSACSSASASASDSAGRVALGGAQRGQRPRRRGAAGGAGADGRLGATVVPVAVDAVEVARRSVVRPSVSIAVCRSMRPVGGGAVASSGSCHGRPVGTASVAGQPVAGRRARATCGSTRGSSHGSPALHVLRVDGQPLDEPEAGLGGAGGQLVDLRPRPLGVDVVGRQRRDAAPVVDAGAAAAAPYSSPIRFGGAWMRMRGPSTQPRDGDVAARSSELGVGHAGHRGVGLGPEVLDDDLLHAAVAPGRRGAARTSTRPARPSVSPMPIRMPVVNGTFERPASSSTRSRTAGSLSGEPKCAPCGSSNSRRDVVSSIMPIDGATGLSRCSSAQRHHAGVQVRQQAGLLEHQDRHRPDVGERRVVAVRVEPLARRGPAVLGPVAEGEQRLLAAQRRALRGDREHLVRRQERRRHPVRRRGERAVVAAVAAQPGQRDEHLARVGDDARAAGVGQALVAHPRRRRAQVDEVVAARAEQDLGLGGVERHPVARAPQRAAQSPMSVIDAVTSCAQPRKYFLAVQLQELRLVRAGRVEHQVVEAEVEVGLDLLDVLVRDRSRR